MAPSPVGEQKPGPPHQGLVDDRAIASGIDDAEKFQGFMAACKERLRAQGANKTN